MEYNQENFEWAMRQIEKFAHLHRTPPAEQLEIHAKALLRLVRSEDLPHPDIWPDGSKHFTGDWLVEQMLETTSFFPNPIDFRKIYCRNWNAADGKSTEDMQAALEG